MRNHLPDAIPRAMTQQLLSDYRALSVEAREDGALEAKIINGNLRFAYHIARRFQEVARSTGAEIEDLFSLASLALVKAVREYDPRVADTPDAKNSFSGFAQRIMTQALVAFVNTRDNATEQPLDLATTFESLPPDLVYDEVLSSDEHEPDTAALARIEIERLLKNVSALPDREAHVVRLRFGIAGFQEHDLAEIGALLGITKQRVASILNTALATLKNKMDPNAAPAPTAEAA